MKKIKKIAEDNGLDINFKDNYTDICYGDVKPYKLNFWKNITKGNPCRKMLINNGQGKIFIVRDTIRRQSPKSALKWYLALCEIPNYKIYIPFSNLIVNSPKTTKSDIIHRVLMDAYTTLDNYKNINCIDTFIKGEDLNC